MKHVKVVGWASILFLLIFASCREDLVPSVSEVRSLDEPTIQVEASITGQVVNEDFAVVANANIRLGDLQTNTDENGVFSFKSVVLNQNGSYITAEKDGYYLGAKMFNPTVGAQSYVAFQLLKKELTGSFQTSQGGEITTADGAKIGFAANSIRYENGAVFTGEVQVYAKWIDPTSQFLAEQMPGDLRAFDSNEALVQLATYGMVAVELEASNGAKLNLIEGNTATLEMPVPAEILADAPTTIPLWSFNEDTGYWIEESSATLQDGKYVGEVPHFSFWNCDAPFPVVKITGTVSNADGDPVPYAGLQIIRSNASVGHGWTNSDGVFCGKVPLNEIMTLKVFDNCENEVASTQIGPFTQETDIGDFFGVQLETATVSGTLVDCDGNAITGGYAYLTGEYYNSLITVDSLTGEFSYTYFNCAEINGEIIGYDLENLLKSEPLTFTVPTNGGDIDLGNLVVCTVITDIIKVSVPALNIYEEYFIYNLNESPNGTSFNANQDSSNVSLGMDLMSPTTGNVPIQYAGFSKYNNNQNERVYLYCEICDVTEAVITQNDGAGGKLVGSWTGMLTNEIDQEEFEVTIEFNLEY